MAELAINGGKPVAGELKVPTWPVVDDEDRKAILEVFERKKWCRLVPDSKVAEFEKAYAQYHQAKHAVAVANGTIAIVLALRASGIKPGDEVLVPAITFIASASAITEIGAIPIFVDSDPDTLSISPAALELAITDHTRAVIVVHYGGYPVDFDAILPIIRKHKIVLIEDSSHAHGTEWKGRRVGAIGDLGTFSFQQFKCLTAGEGGIVVTDNDQLADELMLIHNFGRLPTRPVYEHLILSSNYRMGEFQGVLLLSQLRHLPQQVEHKYNNGEFLAKELTKIGGVEPLKRDNRITKRSYYFFIFKYDQKQFGDVPRDRFIEALNAEGVPVDNAYGMPVYKQQAFSKKAVKKVLSERLGPLPDYERLYLPVAEEFCAKQQVVIIHHVLMAEHKSMEMIVEAIVKIKKNITELR